MAFQPDSSSGGILKPHYIDNRAFPRISAHFRAFPSEVCHLGFLLGPNSFERKPRSPQKGELDMLTRNSEHIRRTGSLPVLAFTFMAAATLVRAQNPRPVASMNVARWEPTATLLNNGLVLVAGGASASYQPIDSAELFDPVTETWRFTRTRMNQPRSYHGAVLLADGRVLLAGGYPTPNSAEIFDPYTETFSPVASMNVGHADNGSQPTFLLNNGKAFVLSGSLSAFGNAVSELYDPQTNSWTVTPPIDVGAANKAAVQLHTGDVLASGGNDGYNYLAYPYVRLYSASTNTVRTMVNLLAPRTAHGMAELPDGRVLIIGGTNGSDQSISTTEIYDPNASPNGQVQFGPTVPTDLCGFATASTNGNVLVIGGFRRPSGTALASLELFDSSTLTWSVVGQMSVPRRRPRVVPLPNGQLLIVSGSSNDSLALSSAEIWPPDRYLATILPPIDTGGTSVFNANRGSVPVKFTLTQSGVATCDLPAATIALTRTSGGTVGPVNESDFIMPSDTGSNFRIDNCQYVYNVGTASLGPGTYRADILIGSSPVGSAVFGLR